MFSIKQITPLTLRTSLLSMLLAFPLGITASQDNATYQTHYQQVKDGVVFTLQTDGASIPSTTIRSFIPVTVGDATVYMNSTEPPLAAAPAQPHPTTEFQPHQNFSPGGWAPKLCSSLGSSSYNGPSISISNNMQGSISINPFALLKAFKSIIYTPQDYQSKRAAQERQQEQARLKASRAHHKKERSKAKKQHKQEASAYKALRLKQEKENFVKEIHNKSDAQTAYKMREEKNEGAINNISENSEPLIHMMLADSPPHSSSSANNPPSPKKTYNPQLEQSHTQLANELPASSPPHIIESKSEPVATVPPVADCPSAPCVNNTSSTKTNIPDLPKSTTNAHSFKNDIDSFYKKISGIKKQASAHSSHSANFKTSSTPKPLPRIVRESKSLLSAERSRNIITAACQHHAPSSLSQMLANKNYQHPQPAATPSSSGNPWQNYQTASQQNFKSYKSMTSSAPAPLPTVASMTQQRVSPERSRHIITSATQRAAHSQIVPSRSYSYAKPAASSSSQGNTFWQDMERARQQNIENRCRAMAQRQWERDEADYRYQVMQGKLAQSRNEQKMVDLLQRMQKDSFLNKWLNTNENLTSPATCLKNDYLKSHNGLTKHTPHTSPPLSLAEIQTIAAQVQATKQHAHRKNSFGQETSHLLSSQAYELLLDHNIDLTAFSSLKGDSFQCIAFKEINDVVEQAAGTYNASSPEDNVSLHTMVAAHVCEAAHSLNRQKHSPDALRLAEFARAIHRTGIASNQSSTSPHSKLTAFESLSPNVQYEIMHYIHRAAQVKNNSNDSAYNNIMTTSVQIADVACQAYYKEKHALGSALLEFGHTVLDCARAYGKGTLQGVTHNLQHKWDHPIQTLAQLSICVVTIAALPLCSISPAAAVGAGVAAGVVGLANITKQLYGLPLLKACNKAGHMSGDFAADCFIMNETVKATTGVAKIVVSETMALMNKARQELSALGSLAKAELAALLESESLIIAGENGLKLAIESQETHIAKAAQQFEMNALDKAKNGMKPGVAGAAPTEPLIAAQEVAQSECDKIRQIVFNRERDITIEEARKLGFRAPQIDKLKAYNKSTGLIEYNTEWPGGMEKAQEVFECLKKEFGNRKLIKEVIDVDKGIHRTFYKFADNSSLQLRSLGKSGQPKIDIIDAYKNIEEKITFI